MILNERPVKALLCFLLSLWDVTVSSLYARRPSASIWRCFALPFAWFFQCLLCKKPNIMLGHNVIYVDTICLCGLHGWSSDSHQSNLSFKSQSFLSPWGSVRVKEHAFPRSSPLTFTITAITSLRKKFFSLPPIPLCHESGDLLCVYHLVHSLGEFLAPPLLKII